jgi:hypothetical protein
LSNEYVLNPYVRASSDLKTSNPYGFLFLGFFSGHRKWLSDGDAVAKALGSTHEQCDKPLRQQGQHSDLGTLFGIDPGCWYEGTRLPADTLH